MPHHTAAPIRCTRVGCGGGRCLSRFDGFVLSACPPEHHGFSPLILRNSLRIHHKSGNGPQVGISQQGGVVFHSLSSGVASTEKPTPRAVPRSFEACVLSALNRLISVRVLRRDGITHLQRLEHPAKPHRQLHDHASTPVVSLRLGKRVGH